MERNFRGSYQQMTRAEILAGEGEASAEQAESVREQVLSFIGGPGTGAVKFLITLRKDGRPAARPVSAYVEGWTVGTISQKEHLKNLHIRNNREVGYLWTESNPEAGKWLRSVWMQGTCEIIEDQDEIADFYKRREAVTGMGDAHAWDENWTRYLLKTTPTIVRAEGFLARSKPAIYRDFSR